MHLAHVRDGAELRIGKGHHLFKLQWNNFRCYCPSSSNRAHPVHRQWHAPRKRPVAAHAALKVVITGSTKGIGIALAKEFVEAGDSVIISSRSEARVLTTVKHLSGLKHAGAEVKGIPCNVSKPADVTALATFAREQLGWIDIWINNAGTNSYKYKLLPELDDNDLINIVETNVLGVMLCCREAIKIMRGQPLMSHIFNMDGAGADGNATPRFAAYGSSKRGLAQLGKSLQAELKFSGIRNICIHNLSPGMVTTELLLSGGDTPTAKFFINCLADPPEVVARFLVPRIRKVAEESNVLGGPKSTYIKYLTKSKAYSQIIARLLLGKRKSRFLKES